MVASKDALQAQRPTHNKHSDQTKSFNKVVFDFYLNPGIYANYLFILWTQLPAELKYYAINLIFIDVMFTFT